MDSSVLVIFLAWVGLSCGTLSKENPFDSKCEDALVAILEESWVDFSKETIFQYRVIEKGGLRVAKWKQIEGIPGDCSINDSNLASMIVQHRHSILQFLEKMQVSEIQGAKLELHTRTDNSTHTSRKWIEIRIIYIEGETIFVEHKGTNLFGRECRDFLINILQPNGFAFNMDTIFQGNRIIGEGVIYGKWQSKIKLPSVNWTDHDLYKRLIGEDTSIFEWLRSTVRGKILVAKFKIDYEGGETGMPDHYTAIHFLYT